MAEREESSLGSPPISGTDLKFMDEHNGNGFGSRPQLACKRLRDLGSSLVSEEFSQSTKTKECCKKDIVGRDERAQSMGGPEALGRRNELISPSSETHNEVLNNFNSSERVSDYNIEAGSYSNKCDLFCSSESHSGLSERDTLDSVNLAGPLLESDSMRVWREMKRNGFLSGPLGGVATLSNSAVLSCHGGTTEQKKCRRKESDTLKTKSESVKQEQVDKFSEIASPSGLLSGLNPGIINKVRNKHQVLSVLEALIKSGFEDDCTSKETIRRE